ncbi:MAG TPA: PIN domain-containing protein [Verrucomicrobiae bacterium]|nr:PIN domain-containing protein [Verrucomicrobiae bacterium]
MTFLDTNVLVYAFDKEESDKHKKAQDILTECWNNRSGTQVLQEFYVTVTRKLAKTLPRQEAREIIKELSAWQIYQPTPADIIAASELEEKHSLSFWDALIVVAAQNSGVTTLISEDMQDGRQIGALKITNPF